MLDCHVGENPIRPCAGGLLVFQLIVHRPSSVDPIRPCVGGEAVCVLGRKPSVHRHKEARDAVGTIVATFTRPKAAVFIRTTNVAFVCTPQRFAVNRTPKSWQRIAADVSRWIGGQIPRSKATKVAIACQRLRLLSPHSGLERLRRLVIHGLTPAARCYRHYRGYEVPSLRDQRIRVVSGD